MRNVFVNCVGVDVQGSSMSAGVRARADHTRPPVKGNYPYSFALQWILPLDRLLFLNTLYLRGTCYNI